MAETNSIYFKTNVEEGNNHIVADVEEVDTQIVEINGQNTQDDKQDVVIAQEEVVEIETAPTVAAQRTSTKSDAPEDFPVLVYEVSVVEEERRGPKPPSGLLQFFAYFVAFTLVWNILDLMRADDVAWQSVTAAKTVTGVIGLTALCMSTKNFRLMKSYAVLVLVVYMLSAVARAFLVHEHGDEWATRICESYRHRHMTEEQCTRQAWNAILVQIFLYALYAPFAFAVSWRFAVDCQRFVREKRAFEKEQESAELPPV